MPKSASELRLPAHLRKARTFSTLRFVSQVMREGRLSTVCEEARCPNIGECFANKTATFMIMGDRCTRRCHFCSVQTKKPLLLDPNEPQAVAAAVFKMGLDYVVITSVDRDELPDGGARHFAKVISQVKLSLPHVKIEVLTGDFRGASGSLDMVLQSPIEVFGHNTETVPRLYQRLRPQSNFLTTISVLQYAVAQKLTLVKTGIMVGLGETDEEVLDTMRLLKDLGVDIITIGQYLRPSIKHWPVARYVDPGAFDHYRNFGYELGFKKVFSGPLVRSSYHAKETSNGL
jgi:lipoic acid synthetase